MSSSAEAGSGCWVEVSTAIARLLLWNKLLGKELWSWDHLLKARCCTVSTAGAGWGGDWLPTEMQNKMPQLGTGKSTPGTSKGDTHPWLVRMGVLIQTPCSVKP